MKYDSINRRFVKSSSKSKILALVQILGMFVVKNMLSERWLIESYCRRRMSAKGLLPNDLPNEFKLHWTVNVAKTAF